MLQARKILGKQICFDLGFKGLRLRALFMLSRHCRFGAVIRVNAFSRILEPDAFPLQCTERTAKKPLKHQKSAGLFAPQPPPPPTAGHLPRWDRHDFSLTYHTIPGLACPPMPYHPLPSHAIPYIRAHVHTYVHTYIRTYMHTYIQTDRQTDRQTDTFLRRCLCVHYCVYAWVPFKTYISRRPRLAVCQHECPESQPFTPNPQPPKAYP